MARKLVWTQLVRQQMKEAFDYYNKRNDSKTYSRFLKNEFLATMRLVAKNPGIGHKTEYPCVRYKVVVPTYSLFYHYDEDRVTVLVLWDNRRNPQKLDYLLHSADPSRVNEPCEPCPKKTEFDNL